MKSRHTLIFLLATSALLVQACGANTQSAVDTAVAQTLQISELQTAAAGGGQQAGTAAPLASNTPGSSPTPSETPTITLTPTPSIPYVRVGENNNCRRGPSTSYSIVMVLNVGEQAQVLKTFGNDYVVVDNLDGDGDCWLWLNYATPASFAVYNLPAATQPPTPTPTFTPTPAFNWAGAWNLKVTDGVTTYSGSMDCNVSGNNISCSVTLNPGALVYTFTGTISSSMQTAGGTYSGAGSGDWDAQIKSGNLSQFVGNLDSGTWEFCGARSGSSIPSPCLWP
ncbi:MAG: SH3 domain-containing protein [Anaerolineales bacterium]